MPIKSDRPDIELSPLGLYDYIFSSLTTEDEDRVAVIDIADGSCLLYTSPSPRD